MAGTAYRLSFDIDVLVLAAAAAGWEIHLVGGRGGRVGKGVWCRAWRGGG